MPKTGKREWECACPTADFGLCFVYFDAVSGFREDDRGSEAVGARSDDDGVPPVEWVMPGTREQTRSVTHGAVRAPAIEQRQNRRWVSG